MFSGCLASTSDVYNAYKHAKMAKNHHFLEKISFFCFFPCFFRKNPWFFEKSRKPGSVYGVVKCQTDPLAPRNAFLDRKTPLELHLDSKIAETALFLIEKPLKNRKTGL